MTLVAPLWPRSHRLIRSTLARSAGVSSHACLRTRESNPTLRMPPVSSALHRTVRLTDTNGLDRGLIEKAEQDSL